MRTGFVCYGGQYDHEAYTSVKGESNVKEKMTKLFQSQPENATCEEIMRELAFGRTIEPGLVDSRNERVISNEDMERRIRTWQK